VGLLWTLFLQLCSSWQDFDWYSASCSLSAVEELLGYSWYRGNVQTPGPLVLWLSSKSIVPRHLSIAKVLSQLCLPDFLQHFSGKMTYCPTWLAVERATGIIIKNSGKFEDLVLMIAERQTYRQRDRDIIQTCYRPSIVNFFTFIFAFLFSCVWICEGEVHFILYKYLPVLPVQAALVWACATKRWWWLGEEMHGFGLVWVEFNAPLYTI